MLTRRTLGAAAAALAAVLCSAAPAAAANYTCESSALRGQLVGGSGFPAIEPVTANKGEVQCHAAQGGGAAALPAPLATSVIFAETGLTGPAETPGAQTATATGGVADLRIGPATSLGAQLGVDQALANVPPVTVPSVGTLDLRAAILAALSPAPEVLSVQIATAYARASCVDGRLALDGSSRLAGVKLLGLELPTNQAVNQTVQIVGGGTITPSQLDLAKLLPPGVTLDPVAEAAVRAALASLPAIQVPPTVALVRIVPNGQTRTATTLTQNALSVQIEVAGQRLVDAVLGEAKVGSNAVDCAVASNAAQAALQCTTRRLVLTDVIRSGRRVRLEGAADKRYIGRTVDIHFVGPLGGGPRVARAKVRQDGTFRTTAALPARKIRGTNRARYQARLGRERSLRLKLQRRMIVRTVRVSEDKVRISGRLTLPLAKPIASIEVRRRVSCRRWVVVKRIRPTRSGSWSTTVDAPPSALAATYRFATKVRKNTRNPKTYPTFTLPRHVDLT